MNRKTNRSIPACIKVRPEVKADIERKTKLGFNFSEWVDLTYATQFMVKEEIESKKAKLEKELAMCNDSLGRISEQEQFEASITLNHVEIDKLRNAVNKFKTLKSQFGVFVYETKREVTQEQFKEMKKKYM